MDNHQHDTVLESHGTVREELLCHFPYAILSVALSIMALSILSYSGFKVKESRQLFHSFHFLHILFSGTGAVLVFRKYSSSKLMALLVGIAVPAVFCTLSDSLLPFVGGSYLGLHMHFHWCFLDHFFTVLPFLIVGVLNGFVVSSHTSSRQLYYSGGSHFLHIFLSSLASIFYLVSYGFSAWGKHMGFVFLFLIIAVLIPCTLADIVVPMGFAHYTKRKGAPEASQACCGSKVEPLKACYGGEEKCDETNKN